MDQRLQRPHSHPGRGGAQAEAKDGRVLLDDEQDAERARVPIGRGQRSPARVTQPANRNARDQRHDREFVAYGVLINAFLNHFISNYPISLY